MLPVLTNTDVSPVKYIVKAWLIAFLPTIVVGTIVTQFFEPKENLLGQESMSAPLVFASVVVFSPIVETLLMMVLFWILKKMTKKPSRLIVSSTIIWACLHSLAWAPWGLVVFWPFIVFSTSYVYWRRKSILKAFAITTSVHAMQNLIPGIITMLSMN